MNVVDEILELFATKGHAAYVGEPVSQLEHALQAAYHAEQAGGDDALVSAALLHDTGISVNYYDHYRHSTYLVENARLFGLSHREQMLTAVVSGWHHGPNFRFDHNRLYHQFLDEADWDATRKLALMLALSETLDETQTRAIRRIAPVI